MDLTTSQFAGALRTEVISRRDPGEAADRYGDIIGGIGVGIARKKSFRIQVGERWFALQRLRNHARPMPNIRTWLPRIEGHIRERPGFT
jgi:hypothetical protein